MWVVPHLEVSHLEAVIVIGGRRRGDNEQPPLLVELVQQGGGGAHAHVDVHGYDDIEFTIKSRYEVQLWRCILSA